MPIPYFINTGKVLIRHYWLRFGYCSYCSQMEQLLHIGTMDVAPDPDSMGGSGTANPTGKGEIWLVIPNYL